MTLDLPLSFPFAITYNVVLQPLQLLILNFSMYPCSYIHRILPPTRVFPLLDGSQDLRVRAEIHGSGYSKGRATSLFYSECKKFPVFVHQLSGKNMSGWATISIHSLRADPDKKILGMEWVAEAVYDGETGYASGVWYDREKTHYFLNNCEGVGSWLSKSGVCF